MPRKSTKIVNENAPKCGATKKVLCQNSDCAECFTRSFASSPFVTFWNESDKNPRYICKSADVELSFKCITCNHEFKRNLSNLSDASKCMYCSGKIICQDKNCKFCFNHTFAAHPRAKYLSKNNTINPQDIIAGAKIKLEFTCDKCNKNFTASLDEITRKHTAKKHPTWCPYC